MLTVQEIRKCKTNTMRINETKEFGQDVYNIGYFTMLHSGHPIAETERQWSEMKEYV